MKKLTAALKNYMAGIDKWLLLFWLGASGLSVLFLSGLMHSELLPSDSRIVQIQAVASLLGLVCALLIALFDYRTLVKFWKLYVPLCLFLVVLTFTGLASVRGDNAAWIRIGFGGFSTTIQPSELLKIAFITTFALHLSKVREQLNRIPHLILLCLHGAAPVLLIQYQGDTGSALVFAAIFFSMLFCAGLNWRYIAAAVGAMALLLPTVVWRYIMSEDQKMRIRILFNPELNTDYSWQQSRALLAFVRGGSGGNGIFSGEHVYVAEAYNDFIFSFIGESTGLIGCIGVVVVLSIIAFRILLKASSAPDDTGRFICIGVFSMITVQMVINIGMNIGVMPVIGVTLPLLSSGGSSVLSMYLGLGLVLSVFRQAANISFFG